MTLTDTERAALDIESRHWRYQATKERHIRETLGMTPVRYYQMLNALLDRPDAVAYAPQTVSRLWAVRGRTRLRRPA